MIKPHSDDEEKTFLIAVIPCLTFVNVVGKSQKQKANQIDEQTRLPIIEQYVAMGKQ